MQPASKSARAAQRTIGAAILALWSAAATAQSAATFPLSMGSLRPQGPAIILTLPPEIQSECDRVRLDPPERRNPPEDRIEYFWRRFDGLLWLGAAGEVAGNISGAWMQLLTPWSAVAAATDDAARKKAWEAFQKKAEERTINRNVQTVSNYQLTLMRCFFPVGADPGIFDPAKLTEAFEALAVGSKAPPGDFISDTRRMASLNQWFHWAAFADAAAGAEDSDLPQADREAWRQVLRMIAYGVLLHAHHDSRQGQYSQRVRLMPAGLEVTTPEGIRKFVAGADPRLLLYELYRLRGKPPMAMPMRHKH